MAAIPFFGYDATDGYSKAAADCVIDFSDNALFSSRFPTVPTGWTIYNWTHNDFFDFPVYQINSPLEDAVSAADTTEKLFTIPKGQSLYTVCGFIEPDSFRSPHSNTVVPSRTGGSPYHLYGTLANNRFSMGLQTSTVDPAAVTFVEATQLLVIPGEQRINGYSGVSTQDPVTAANFTPTAGGYAIMWEFEEYPTIQAPFPGQYVVWIIICNNLAAHSGTDLGIRFGVTPEIGANVSHDRFCCSPVDTDVSPYGGATRSIFIGLEIYSRVDSKFNAKGYTRLVANPTIVPENSEYSYSIQAPASEQEFSNCTVISGALADSNTGRAGKLKWRWTKTNLGHYYETGLTYSTPRTNQYYVKPYEVLNLSYEDDD